MENEDQFFLVTQRDALAYAASGTRKSPKFEVHYTKLGVKKKLSRKANTSPGDDGTLIEADQFYQYCVVDGQDRLVKPKKITKKGKTLRVDINDAHFLELRNFFGNDKDKQVISKFVSHLNEGTGNFEAISAADEQVVELSSAHQDVAWCSRAGFTQAPDAVGQDIYAAEDLRYGQIFAAVPVAPVSEVVVPVVVAPVVVASEAVAVAALPSLLPSFSPWVSGGAAAIALLSRGGSSGATAVAPVPPVVSDLVVHGNIMLGPLIDGSDLRVTAYDANGNILPSSTGNPITVTPNGTGGFDYAITITGGYRGVVTVRLSNSGGNLDYVSEFSAAQVNLGNGALLASDNVAATANEWVINITQATDLAARRVLSAASVDTEAPKLATGVQASDVTDANIAVTNAFLPNLAGQSITQLLPKSTIGKDGKPSGDTSDYALLLHTLDAVTQQAATSANPFTLQQVQANISKLLTWPNADYKTATLKTQLPLLDTTKTDAANHVWVPSLAVDFEQNENVANAYLATVKPADIPTNPATGQPYQVTYQITGGADKALFDINPSTGQLTWKTAPDYEAPKDQGADNTYQVIVTAVTNAPLTSAYLSSSQVVNIHVNNVAESTTPVAPVTPVVPDLVIQGQGMLGPIVAGTDLVVTAYKSDGTVLGSTTVVPDTVQDGRTYNYKITVAGQGNYRGPVTVRLTNGGAGNDYVSESTGQAKNLADGSLLATDVVTTNWVTSSVNLKIINITQATDLAARKVLDPTTVDDLAKAPVVKATEAQVTDANIAVTDALVPSQAGKSVPITQLLPTSTIKTDGTSSGDTSDYALLLHSMDVITQSQPLADPTPLKTTQQKLFGLLTWPDTVNVYKTAVLPVAPLVDTTDAAQPESSLITLTVAENSTLTYNASVKASKIPAGATVTYAITGGGDAAKFDIDPTTGVLTLKAGVATPNFDDPLDYGKDNVYDVIITATTDTGLATGYLRASQAVKFKITNLPDTPPIFLDNTTPGTKIADSTPLDVTVDSGTLAAYTPNVKFDAATDTHVYTLSGGANAANFTIDPTTGVVSFKTAPVEWRTEQTYTVEVTASDTTVQTALTSPTPSQYQDTQTVNIKVKPLLAQETLDAFAAASEETVPVPDASHYKFPDDTFVIKFNVAVSLTTDATKKLHFVDETGTAVDVDIDLTNPAQAVLSADGKTLTITPPTHLDGDSNYHIEFDVGALRIGGQDLPALTGDNNGLDFTTQPPFTLHIADGINDLEVTSQIVLTTNSAAIATATAGKKIHFKNLADSGTKTGFSGESASHDFDIDAADTRYVTLLANGNVAIKPPFDFDFANHYQITVDAGAFSTAADASGKVRSIVATQTDAAATGALLFSTVNVAANKAAADLAGPAQTMADDGTVSADGKKWFAVDGATSDTDVDLSGSAYAMVFKDQNTDGHNPNVNDGVSASKFAITAHHFGSDDLVYADDQNNDKDKLNNAAFTQILDDGTANTLKLDFDPDTNPTTNPTGGRGTLTLEGEGSLAIQDVIDRLNIANTLTLPNKITGVQRVNSDGTDSTLTTLGPEVTASAPAKVKVSTDLATGDTVQLCYIDASGAITLIGSAHTVDATEAGNHAVTLDLTLTQLGSLPYPEGNNKIFAKVINSTGAVSYSSLLGGGQGVYVDTSAAFSNPATTITLGAGQDDNLDTSAETSVDLVVQANELKVGDILALKLVGATTAFTAYKITIDGTEHTGPYTYAASDFGKNVVFTVNKTDLSVGANTFNIQRTDAAGNVAQTNDKVITRTDYVTYSGNLGLGPVVSGNDLEVTAYDKDGHSLGVAKVGNDGTYSLDIDKTYTGAITLRVANKVATNGNGTPDYWDAATEAQKDMGATGSIAAVFNADGASHTVHITALTDLVARELSANNAVSDADAVKISAYNLQLTQKLLNSTATDAATQGITSLAPNFTLTAAGAAESAANLVANTYGQLLAQISKQALVTGKTMDEVQTLLKNAITWTWTAPVAPATSGSATAALSGDIAKQVVLLAKVAQAAALATGADASSILTATDITNYLEPSGTGPITALSNDRKADLMARIVASADNGSALDTRTELQNFAQQVVALAKIQDYAANTDANADGVNDNPAPTVTDYTAAGVTAVTADNLAAVNATLLNHNAAKNGSDGTTHTVPNDSAITTAITTAQTAALTKIQNYASSATNPQPTLDDYALVGITGVNAANLGAINTKIDASIALNTLATANVTSITRADIQTVVTNEAIPSFNAALNLIRAYILDSTALGNPAPTSSTYQDAGLSFIDTADEIGSANAYLSKVLVNENALPGNASYVNDAPLIQKLTAQHTALLAISTYAQSGGTAPSETVYQAAGITLANTTNLSALNALVDAKVGTDVDTFDELAALLGPAFIGTPSITSIALAGLTVGTAPLVNDSYLSGTEIAATGQTAKFAVHFDRAVKGVTAANFDLTDTAGNPITGHTLTVTCDDASGEGANWTVSVDTLAGLADGTTMRLNLVNNLNSIQDTQGSNSPTAGFTSGQYYTVDTSNTVSLAVASGEDAELIKSEDRIHLFVSADHLHLGDTLKLTKKADGTQVVGTTTVTVDAAVLGNGGYTFEVLKADLGASNSTELELTSTDLAGNTATAQVTITQPEYISIIGTVGLPSKVLHDQNLTVTAYGADGSVLGTGTIKADNTYQLDVRKGTTGPVTLKITDGSGTTLTDYWDEAKPGAANLGGAGESIAATIHMSSSSTGEVAHITLLTDLAARIITREYGASATSAQVTAVNTAIAQCLLSRSSLDITKGDPDFAVDTSGNPTAGTSAAATRYGQLLTQLAQQAHDRGSSLAVELDHMAGGISWNGTTSVATLTTDFAKQVFLLAKTQMAAALDNPLGTLASMDAVLSFQDLIDGGITGLSGLTSNAGKAEERKADLIKRIVATANSGNDADTMAEIQALANKAVAIAKIKDYADLVTPTASQTPSVNDYIDAGFGSLITTDNLVSVNKNVFNSSTSAIPSDGALQTLVNKGVTDHTNAVAIIAAYTGNVAGATAPSKDDYENAGVRNLSVTDQNLATVNAAIHAAALMNPAASDADKSAQIQNLVYSGILVYESALLTLRHYITGQGSETPNASTYRDAGLSDIDTAGEVDSANQYLNDVMTNGDANLSDPAILGKLTAQKTALAYINDYALDPTSHSGVAPSASQYLAAGITGATPANLGTLNAAVDAASSTATLADLKTAIASAHIDASDLLSAAASPAGQAIFSHLSAAALDNIQEIKVALTGDIDPAHDQINFGGFAHAINSTADSDGGTPITINGIAGIRWQYNANKTLTFTKADNSAFTAAEALSLEQSLTFTTSDLAPTTQGSRTFTLKHTDTGGNSVSPATSTLQQLDAFTAISNIDANYPNALAVAAGMTLDMNTYLHSDIGVITLGAGATAKVDLGDILQNTTNAGGTHQLLINGTDSTSQVLFDTPSMNSEIWTKLATTTQSSDLHHTYDVYENSALHVQLLIEQFVQRSGLVL